MRVEEFLSTETLARRPKPTQGCRANDHDDGGGGGYCDDDDDDDDDEIPAVSCV